MSGQLWVLDTAGGYFYSKNLSKELRTAVQPTCKFRQFADVKDASQQGKKKGDTFTWDVVSDVATAGGTLVETNVMPETNFTIAQATLTITEYGNSVPYSGKLEALSQFEVREPVMKALKNDTSKVMDRAAWAQFNQTLLRYVATTATNTGTLYTNGSATGTNSIALGKGHVKNIGDLMRERNIPGYSGDDYMSLAWPTTYRQLKDDLESLKAYTVEGLRDIYAGEIGRFEKCRFVEQTNVVKGISTNGVTGTAWGNGKSDWAFFFGEDTVAEAIAIPEEMRAKIPTDYGRSKGVAWYYLGGFGIVHTAAAQTRIVKWDSQG